MLFHIKNATDRQATNLIPYSNAIRTAVLSIFPSAVVNIYNSYFEVLNVPSASYTALRSMGRSIVAACPHLNSLKRTYGKSTQLFVSF